METTAEDLAYFAGAMSFHTETFHRSYRAFVDNRAYIIAEPIEPRPGSIRITLLAKPFYDLPDRDQPRRLVRVSRRIDDAWEFLREHGPFEGRDWRRELMRHAVDELDKAAAP